MDQIVMGEDERLFQKEGFDRGGEPFLFLGEKGLAASELIGVIALKGVELAPAAVNAMEPMKDRSAGFHVLFGDLGRDEAVVAHDVAVDHVAGRFIVIIKFWPNPIRGDEGEDFPFVLRGIERGIRGFLEPENLLIVDQVGSVRKTIRQINEAFDVFVGQILVKLLDDAHVPLL